MIAFEPEPDQPGESEDPDEIKPSKPVPVFANEAEERDDRQEKLERFFMEVTNLTVNHKVIAGEAVVYPSALGEALNRVDPDWPGRPIYKEPAPNH